MVKYILTLSYILLLQSAQAQLKIDPIKIDIVRDSFGVPHIFAKTDAEVAYGLAYAHAEDDFNTIQLGFLSGKSMLGLHKGKAGAQIDYIAYLLRCQQTAREKYESDIAADYKKVLEGYCQGFNAYAKAHPKEVLVKSMLPLVPTDMIAYSILQLAISSGTDKALAQIYNGSVATLSAFSSGGSNAYAFNSKKTVDGNTYLNINAHQPLNGPVSWYEAHLCSEEGWNITGALFACTPSILLGSNEYLGWAHTVNYPDKLDVYQLEMNPANKTSYKFDNSWENLEVKTARLRIKIAGITVSAKRKVYWSKYGPTMITKKGTFAIRTAALFDIRSLETWYRMNKATNFTSFYKALKMEALPGYNVMYADRFDTIFYLSNGKIPIRNKEFNWKGTLPGNTSKTLWSRYHPLESLPQYTNPAAGYLYNSNHSPFNATAKPNNLKATDFDATMGYETWENNRSVRFMELLKPLTKITYEDFKRIKFDRQLPAKLEYVGANVDTLFMLDLKEYPGLAEIIVTLKNWDRRATTESEGAAAFSILYYHIAAKIRNGEPGYASLTKNKSVEALTYAQNYLLSNFGRTRVSLGAYQKLVKANKILELPGLPDVIASMESEPYKNGMVKGKQGESFIQLVNFTKQGPKIETIHSYGASKKSGNKHETDQMEMFVADKLKLMTLDKSTVYKSAEKIYHPK